MGCAWRAALGVVGVALNNCGKCFYMRRTSPEQVFLKCEFWSASPLPVRGVLKVVDRDYIIGHCHRQPEAPACPFFKPREASGGADDVTRPLPDAC